MSYRLTPNAQADLEDIYRYSYENFGERQAEAYYDSLMGACDLLGENPRLGREYNEVDQGLRRHEHARHVVYYEIEDLRNHSASVRWQDCADCDGDANRILLIFVPETEDAICETLEAMPKAWKRAGGQNIPLTEQDREQLRRDKRIASFERRLTARYDVADVDQGLLTEIRKTWPEIVGVDRSDEDLLYEFGAIERTAQDSMFTSNSRSWPMTELIVRFWHKYGKIKE